MLALGMLRINQMKSSGGCTAITVSVYGWTHILVVSGLTLWFQPWVLDLLEIYKLISVLYSFPIAM